MNGKIRAARLSIFSNLLLVIAKLAVGEMSGSISMISEAIHSAVDLVASLLAMVSIQAASKPADREHNFGHGKIENLSALVEGVLVLFAGGWVIYEAGSKLRVVQAPTASGLVLAVMGLSAGLNWLVSRYLFSVARTAESAALEADALHLRIDVWTSGAVFGGLFLARVTGIAWLDPVMALLVAVMILKAGYDLCVTSLTPLVDARLHQEEEREIIQLIRLHHDGFVEFHDLRTRRSGAERHIDFHLVTHGNRSLQEVHRLCDRIEEAISNRFPTAHVLIHPEPCHPDCEHCRRKE